MQSWRIYKRQEKAFKVYRGIPNEGASLAFAFTVNVQDGFIPGGVISALSSDDETEALGVPCMLKVVDLGMVWQGSWRSQQ